MSEHQQHDMPPSRAAELPEGSVFRAAFESSRSVMFLVDPASGEIISANPAACQFYGYDPAELDALSPEAISLLPPDRLRELLNSLHTEGATRFASRHRLKTGQFRDMELDAAPITLHSGRTCLFFVGHDITPRKEAEAALRQREGLLRAILDSAGDGICFKDTQGVYREANPAFCTLVGSPCAEVLGRESKFFFDRRVSTLNVESDRRSMSERAPVTYELDIPGPEGPRSISVHKSPVFDATGECLGVVSISRDITERRQAEAALRKSEGLLRAMLQSAQDSIFITDENDVLRELNQAFCTHAGRQREELFGKTLAEIFSGEELRIQLSTNALARQTREPVSFTQRMQPGGRDYWISVVKTAVVDSGGNCLGVLGMGRDITAQRAAEQALRQSERRLSSLIRQAPVGVFETDVAGRLVFANERMQRQTGRPLQGLTGNQWLERIAPEDREDFLNVWRETQARKIELDRELRLLDGQSRTLWTSVRVRPMFDAANRFSGYLGVLSDISERKKAEALRADVESVVRHDLKSPLGSVQNALELLEMLGPLNQEQELVLREVRGLTRRMQVLISLSLDLHGMEAGVYKPDLQPVDLCAVVDELRVELRHLLEGKQLRLEVVSPCPDEPFLVQGERRLLDSVFANLLKNAAEAAPEGGALSVRLEQADSQASVQIRNAGEVPFSVRDRFFEKYATAGKVHGTGLGTYSARLMVRTMGGSLDVDCSEPGFTTLRMRLAAALPAPAALGQPAATPADPDTASGPQPDDTSL